jgi:hypothetical protein
MNGRPQQSIIPIDLFSMAVVREGSGCYSDFLFLAFDREAGEEIFGTKDICGSELNSAWKENGKRV